MPRSNQMLLSDMIQYSQIFYGPYRLELYPDMSVKVYRRYLGLKELQSTRTTTPAEDLVGEGKYLDGPRALVVQGKLPEPDRDCLEKVLREEVLT